MIRPLLRIAMSVVCAACVVLSLGAGWAWVRSFSRVVYVYYGCPSGPYVFWAEGGRFIAHAGGSVYDSGKVGWRASNSSLAWRERPWQTYVPGIVTHHALVGDFGYVQGSYPLTIVAPPNDPPVRNQRGTFKMVVVPGWAVTLLAAFPPAWWFPRLFRGVRARRRTRRGLCPNCGYDLRGTSDICPECGTPVTPATPAEPGGTFGGVGIELPRP